MAQPRLARASSLAQYACPLAYQGETAGCEYMRPLSPDSRCILHQQLFQRKKHVTCRTHSSNVTCFTCTPVKKWRFGRESLSG